MKTEPEMPEWNVAYFRHEWLERGDHVRLSPVHNEELLHEVQSGGLRGWPVAAHGEAHHVLGQRPHLVLQESQVSQPQAHTVSQGGADPILFESGQRKKIIIYVKKKRQNTRYVNFSLY